MEEFHSLTSENFVESITLNSSLYPALKDCSSIIFYDYQYKIVSLLVLVKGGEWSLEQIPAKFNDPILGYTLHFLFDCDYLLRHRARMS